MRRPRLPCISTNVDLPRLFSRNVGRLTGAIREFSRHNGTLAPPSALFVLFLHVLEQQASRVLHGKVW